ncbi:MAG: hypothetical protein FWE09_09420, partial [Treponema sp.]|nr:hypothetical protein [Treponema sp.]
MKIFIGAILAALALSGCAGIQRAGEEPAIIRQPANVALTQGQRARLSVEASAPAGGELSYQWFATRDEVNRNSDDIQIIGNQALFIPPPNSGGRAIAGATAASFEPPTDESGIASYYVEVTARSAGGATATTASDAATVAVRPLDAPVILFVCGGNT